MILTTVVLIEVFIHCVYIVLHSLFTFGWLYKSLKHHWYITNTSLIHHCLNSSGTIGWLGRELCCSLLYSLSLGGTLGSGCRRSLGPELLILVVWEMCFKAAEGPEVCYSHNLSQMGMMVMVSSHSVTDPTLTLSFRFSGCFMAINRIHSGG